MHHETILIPDPDRLRGAIRKYGESEDESVRKEAEALGRALHDAEGNLEGVAATLAMGVRPLLPSLTSSRAVFVSGLLDGVPQAKGTGRPMIEAMLEFSRRFDRHRGEGVSPEVEQGEPSLERIRDEIEDCNELCRVYGDLFALIQQETRQQDEWTKRLEIGSKSVLTAIISKETERSREAQQEVVPEPKAEVLTEPEPRSSADEWLEIPALPPEDVQPEPVRQAAPVASPLPEARRTVERPTEEVPVSETEAPARPKADASAGGKCADVVFVVDASGSMRTCFDQLRANIRKFVEPFREEGFDSLRLGLLAYSANIDRTARKCIYRNIVVGGEGVHAMKALYGAAPARDDLFFTRSKDGAVDVETFMRRLDGIRCKGDEDTVFALDCAADFPFGPLESTRRVVVLFTDEKVEDGVLGLESVGENFARLEKVMGKIVDRHVGLYAFAPASPATDLMSEFSRVYMTAVPEFRPEATGTWANVDFGRILEMMGRTVSSSLSGGREQDWSRALFGQNAWEDDRWS